MFRFFVFSVMKEDVLHSDLTSELYMRGLGVEEILK